MHFFRPRSRDLPVMTVELITVSRQRREPQESLSLAHVSVEEGIAGDRYKDVTLVEAEEIEAFCHEQHLPVDFTCTRRNIITRGVRLNPLVGKEFRIGPFACAAWSCAIPAEAWGAASPPQT